MDNRQRIINMWRRKDSIVSYVCIWKGAFVGACLFFLLGCVERNPAYVGGDDNEDAAATRSDAGARDTSTVTDQIAREDGAPTQPPLPCNSNGDCPEPTYCRFDQGCGGADQPPGTCEPRPRECPEIESPVCGCDGQTYSNTCVAAHYRAAVRYPGECEEPPDCEEIDDAYREAIELARACKVLQPSQQCNLVVEDSLLCPCKIHINKGNNAAVNDANQLRKAFLDAGCQSIDCDRQCPFFNIGVCLPASGGGQCQEV